MRTTEPFRASVRKLVVREGKVSISFEGMNSWYAVPPHLEAVIRRAAGHRRAIAITTTKDAVLTAERSRPRHKFRATAAPRWQTTWPLAERSAAASTTAYEADTGRRPSHRAASGRRARAMSGDAIVILELKQ